MSLGETYLSISDTAGQLGLSCHSVKSRELQEEGVSLGLSQKQQVHMLCMGNVSVWAGIWGRWGEGGGVMRGGR